MEFAGPVLAKTCPVCQGRKPLEEFHRQRSGRHSRHAYCRDCANRVQRETRVRNYDKESKRKWQRKSRYGLTEDDYQEMLRRQNGRCAICEKAMPRPCVDHCHVSGRVRGILCHQCNIRLGGWDDLPWRGAALRYLGLVSEEDEPDLADFNLDL